MRYLPVLQIIHITDLHFKHVATQGSEQLYARRRWVSRFAQYCIEKWNIGNWSEGTQGHYQHAPRAFERFLRNWRERDARWYGRPGEDSAVTWLVDSGDLTAFGDDKSLALGRRWIDKWSQAAGAVCTRSIYGNHDAWPAVHPVHGVFGRMDEEMRAQWDRVCQAPAWREREWLNQPCEVKIPQSRSRIELYALNTVCWSPSQNTRAVGELSEVDLAAYRRRLAALWTDESRRHFRILVTHHPIVFPSKNIMPFVLTMGLKNADKCVRELRNTEGEPKDLGVLANLFLSGHTHVAYPTGPLKANASDIYQGSLAPNQLQFVGGPLMLNKALSAAKEPATKTRVELPAKRFSIAEGDARNCQAQIFRFFWSEEAPGELLMYRIPIWSEDGSIYDSDTPSEGVKVTFESG